MTETTETITEWANATFGVPSTNMSIWERADKEFNELFNKLDDDDRHPGVPEEIADVVIVLSRILHRFGTDLATEVDKKMAINRARKWVLTGDGHGQHEG